jgi:hypothetical protein
LGLGEKDIFEERIKEPAVAPIPPPLAGLAQ